MVSIPQIAARQRDWPNSFRASPSEGAFYPITFPTTPLVIKAELLLGGSWVDITSGPNGIYYETRIKIKRGRENESSRAQPSSCKIKLKNPNRMWSPRNRNGPYYGLLNRNVKLRITVNPGDNEYVRFIGYVSKWPQKWTTGDHRWVEIEANGILRRLGMGKSPLKSPIYRSVTANNPFAYWPLTEVADSPSAASTVIGGGPFVPSGDLAFGGFTDAPDGQNAPAVKSGRLETTVAPLITTPCTGWMLGFAARMTAVDIVDRRPMLRFSTDGFISDFTIYPPTNDLLFRMQADVSDTFGTTATSIVMTPLWSAGELGSLYDEQWHYFQLVTWQTSGPTQQFRAYIDGELAGIGVGLPLPVSSTGIGRPTSIRINPEGWNFETYGYSIRDVSLIETAAVIADNGLAFQAYIGESPTARFARLCEEEGIDYTIAELVDDTETMGAQGLGTLLDLLRECEAVNEGVMDEDKEGRLRLISRTFSWNQPPSMLIDYSTGAVKEGFDPTDDDLIARNDWTITRKNGGTRRAVQLTGPLNINDPATDNNGISQYDDSATLNLETDDQAYQHATLRLARGTIDEIRIAKLPLHFSSSPTLLAYWLDMDIQKRFQLSNTPDDIGGTLVDQLMIGYEESIDRLEWTATLYGQPASLESVGIIDDYAYLDCDACTLAEELDTTETAIDTAIADTCTWVSISIPFDIVFGGEVATVTAIAAPVGAGSSWTQTLTVTRSVNGVVKTHAIGTEVHVNVPFILVL